MKQLTSKDRAGVVLGPYLDILQIIYSESLEELNRIRNATRIILNQRSLSQLMHNFAMELSKKHFEPHKAKVRILEKYSSLQLVFKDEQPIVGRFKKLNKKGLPSNVATKRSEAINNQTSLFEFEVTYVDFGYRLDPTNTNFDLIGVICRKGDSMKWDITISESGVTTTPEKSVTAEKVEPITKTQLKAKRNAKSKS